MDPLLMLSLLLALLVVVNLAAMAGVLSLRASGGPPRVAVAPRLRPPEHVHTYRRASTEETGGATIAVYRCAACGDVERWEVA